MSNTYLLVDLIAGGKFTLLRDLHHRLKTGL
jgi:hypothetical protein